MSAGRPFGSIEPLDRVKMKSWLSETGVASVRVVEIEGVDMMQRVSVTNVKFGVKKRFQKAPKSNPKTSEFYEKIIKDATGNER